MLKAQQMRNEGVQCLAGEMADMMQVLGEVPSFEKIKSLEGTVTAMMTKIEECGNFITEFVALGFLSMLSFVSFLISEPDAYYRADGNRFFLGRPENRRIQIVIPKTQG